MQSNVHASVTVDDLNNMIIQLLFALNTALAGVQLFKAFLSRCTLSANTEGTHVAPGPVANMAFLLRTRNNSIHHSNWIMVMTPK